MIEVKTRFGEFQDVWMRRKLSELRFDDDKDYRIGRTLLQREYMHMKRVYTGRYVKADISGITRLSNWIAGVDYRWVIVHLDPDTFERGLSVPNENLSQKSENSDTLSEPVAANDTPNASVVPGGDK